MISSDDEHYPDDAPPSSDFPADDFIESGKFADADLSELAALDKTPAPPQNEDESPEYSSRRCARCGTTWDRMKEGGRVGCADCYETFAEQLRPVLQRVHGSPQHIGKAPRHREKRLRRLNYLRTQRDHRLEMLQRRLQESLHAERYEEAAALRDKIRFLQNTIVED